MLENCLGSLFYAVLICGSATMLLFLPGLLASSIAEYLDVPSKAIVSAVYFAGVVYLFRRKSVFGLIKTAAAWGYFIFFMVLWLYRAR